MPDTVQINVQVTGAQAGVAALGQVGGAAAAVAPAANQAAAGVNNAARANANVARTASPAATNSRELAASLAAVAGQGGPLSAAMMQISRAIDSASASAGGLKAVAQSLVSSAAFAGLIAAASSLVSNLVQLKQAIDDVGAAEQRVFGESSGWLANLGDAFREGYGGGAKAINLAAPAAAELAGQTDAVRAKQLKALLEASKPKSAEDQVAAEWLASGRSLTGAEAAAAFRAAVEQREAAQKGAANDPNDSARQEINRAAYSVMYGGEDSAAARAFQIYGSKEWLDLGEDDAERLFHFKNIDVASQKKIADYDRLAKLETAQANTAKKRTMEEAILAAAEKLERAEANLEAATANRPYWQGGKGGANLNFGLGPDQGMAGLIDFDVSGNGTLADEMLRANWTGGDRARARQEQKKRDKLVAKLAAQRNNGFAHLTNSERALLTSAAFAEADSASAIADADFSRQWAKDDLNRAKDAAADFADSIDDTQMAADIAAIRANLKVVN